MNDGELVAVAFAGDRTEAEMLQGLLESVGIPSLLKPSGLVPSNRGFADPRFAYGGGSQHVMVHAHRAEEAREMLAETPVPGQEAEWPELANARHLERAQGGGRGPRNYGSFGASMRTLAVAVIFFALAFGVFLLLRAV